MFKDYFKRIMDKLVKTFETMDLIFYGWLLLIIVLGIIF